MKRYILTALLLSTVCSVGAAFKGKWVASRMEEIQSHAERIQDMTGNPEISKHAEEISQQAGSVHSAAQQSHNNPATASQAKKHNNPSKHNNPKKYKKANTEQKKQRATTMINPYS